MAKISLVYFHPPSHAQGCFVASLVEDQSKLRRMKLQHGDVVTIEVKKERNGKHHRLVFEMLNFTFENQCRFSSLYALRWHLTMQTSFVNEHRDEATGEIIRIPRSWSYEEMDEIEFSKLHDEIVNAILQSFYPTETQNWLKKSIGERAFLDGILGFI